MSKIGNNILMQLLERFSVRQSLFILFQRRYNVLSMVYLTAYHISPYVFIMGEHLSFQVWLIVYV